MSDIHEEVLRIQRLPPEMGGRELNRLADEFRSGRAVCDVMDLVDSHDPEQMWVGLYILAETGCRRLSGPAFIDRIRALTTHSHELVRYYASSVLFPLD